MPPCNTKRATSAAFGTPSCPGIMQVLQRNLSRNPSVHLTQIQMILGAGNARTGRMSPPWRMAWGTAPSWLGSSGAWMLPAPALPLKWSSTPFACSPTTRCAHEPGNQSCMPRPGLASQTSSIPFACVPAQGWGGTGSEHQPAILCPGFAPELELYDCRVFTNTQVSAWDWPRPLHAAPRACFCIEAVYQSRAY